MKRITLMCLVLFMTFMVSACGTLNKGNSGKIIAHVDPSVLAELEDVEVEKVMIVEDESPVKYHGPKEIEPEVIITKTIEEDKPLPVVKPTKVAIVGDILFPLDEDIITVEEQTNVDKLAALMLEYPDTKIQVLGYACFLGSDEHNIDLSQRRANSIKADLVRQGVEADRIEAKGMGEVDLFGAMLKLNRRAVIRSID